jgi:hypothetical protein
VRQFGGSEPLVGEVFGLRSFRVDESGLLLPLYSNDTWYDGRNTAQCVPPTGHHQHGGHRVPSEHCECGFYAYGTVEAAGHTRQMRYVQAVVACWGGLIAGTQGVRAQHARIVALWMNPAAPTWVRRRVATRYPSARLYADASVMLAEHPLSELPCYAAPERRRACSRPLATAGGAAVLVVGLLPLPVLRHTDLLWALWLAVTVAAGAVTAWLLVGARSAGHLAAAAVAAAVLAWLVAPALGLSGWLLRLPLLRGVAVAAGGYVLALWPRHFPVERTPRLPALRP